MRVPLLSLILVLAHVASAGLANAESDAVPLPPAAKPNIVIILADDLGYGDAACFNPQSKIPTPNIDRLASAGMRFTDAHAAGSVCVPSRYGLLTGRFPFRTWSSEGKQATERKGVEAPHYRAPMLMHEPGRLNLAAMLKKNGYVTACFGKWHQGMNLKADAGGILSVTPVDLGFDYYFGFDAPEQPPYAFIENKRFVAPPSERVKEQMGVDVTNPKMQGAHWAAGEATPGWDFYQALPTIAHRADQWLTRHAAGENPAPFFIYHSLPAPHAPWTPLDKYKGRSGAGQYGDYVMEVDAIVGQLLDTLDRLKLADRTLLFFSSDNGPVWFDQDVQRYGHKAAGPLRGMKGALHEAGHRMPFIARWPGKIKAGATCDELICLTDLMATLAAVAGANLPEDAGEDSFDISPLLSGPPPGKPIRAGMIHPNWGSYTLAIRERDWKLILPQRVYTVEDRSIKPDRVVASSGKRSLDAFELYNLKDDPAEANNLADKMPEKVGALFALLKANIERGASR